MLVREDDTLLQRLIAQYIERAAMGAVERGEEEVLAGNVSTCSEGIGNGPVRHLRGVVLLREVAEEDVAQVGVEIIRNELCTGLVALVPSRGEDTLL